jgi:hypothetical protein
MRAYQPTPLPCMPANRRLNHQRACLAHTHVGWFAPRALATSMDETPEQSKQRDPTQASTRYRHDRLLLPHRRRANRLKRTVTSARMNDSQGFATTGESAKA